GVGPKGALALGLTSGLIAAPCTGPVLAFLLAWIGTTGNVAFGGAALFVYSLGLGLLFFLVGTFAITLPKSGRWLEWIKSLFGIVMVVMALYYVRDLLPLERPVERTETWIGAGLIMTVLGVALGAIHLSFHGAGAMARLRKGTGISLAVLGVTAALWWAEALPPGTKMAWLHDYEEATTLAQATGRPLLVDFGASWCAACGELDRDTFSDPR
ncbi:MAG: thioredoxin family protein, partial [Myxococcales bacterium]|nr:thioredoxin family protein [Myxococcales bacterium]